MTEQETFNEWVKQLEPSMAVPMYPKALLLDFMKKAFFAGLEQHSHDYLVKTKDLKANFDLAIEGRDIKIKELEQQTEKMKRHCNCKHRDSEGYCEVKRTYLIDLSYDGCDKWELED